MRKLSAKQEAFAQLVAKGAAPAEAYRKAYRSKMGQHALRTEGNRLLKNPAVSLRAGSLRAPALVEVQKNITVDLVRTLFENARIGFSDLRHLLTPAGSLKPPAEWDDDTAAAVSSIKVKELYADGEDGREQIGHVTEVKLWDKGAALDRLMKHLGMYERDNAQRAGLFDRLPAEAAQRIIDRIDELERRG